MGYHEGTSPIVISDYQEQVRKLERAANSVAATDRDKALKLLRQAHLYEGKLVSLAYGDTKREHTQRAERLQTLVQRLESGEPLHPPRAAPKPAAKASGKKPGSPVPEEASGDDEAESFKAWARTLKRSGSVPWDRIAGLHETKGLLMEAVNLFMAKRPEGVKIHGYNNVMLFGPAGTGKTLLATALASRLHLNFFELSLHDMRSKWVGETGKRFKAVFQVAREEQPSIVFVDEMTELGRRGEDQHEVSRQLHDQFLIETEGLGSKIDARSVLLLGATNYPWELTDKVLSRFQHLVYVPLPDEEARADILRIHIEGDGHRTNVSWKDLARRSEGYSGRELRDVAREAVMGMVRDINPWMSEPNALEGGLPEIKVRPLEPADFDRALTRIKPKNKRSEVDKLEAWAKEHASGGGA